jgi:uncharacterized protein
VPELTFPPSFAPKKQGMKRALAIADRAALLSLRLLAAVNLLFFLSFIVILLLAAGKAHAEEPVCSGTNLMATLQANDPAAYGKIETEASATPNGEGVFWKLEKPGSPTSWLLGTMHSTDPRITTVPATVQTAFNSAHTLIIETTDVLDQTKMAAALMAQPDLTTLAGGDTLSSLMPPDDEDVVAKALDARGIPLGSVEKMQPWLLSTVVSVPVCEAKRQAAGKAVLDVKLAGEAKAQGKDVKGLETATEQLRALASQPIPVQIKGLVQTLKFGDKIDDVTETMVDLYTQGEVAAIWPLFRVVMPEGPDEQGGYATFEQIIVTQRNKVMAERATPILAKGNVFMAVGALHLPGNDGLVSAFRRAGYTVTAVD